MIFGWSEVTIGNAAERIERPEIPMPGVTYRQIGVRLWGEGSYERESLDGGQTNYKTLNRVEAGDIIINKIWARNGSVSVVSDSLAGCYCSGEFPLFHPKPDLLDPRWFYWITKTRWFWHLCDVQSRGTSGKNRIRPEKFLAIPIPLPPFLGSLHPLEFPFHFSVGNRINTEARTYSMEKNDILPVFRRSA